MSHKKVVRIDPLTCALPPFGVDSHAHLTNEAFQGEVEEILTRARGVGISHLVNIFLNPLSFEQEKAVFAQHPNVVFALGIHPSDGHLFGEEAFLAMERAFSAEIRLRAVGEIGLDYYWKDCPRELQLSLFARQLDFARSRNKAVIIHCREAEKDCLTVLESRGFVGYPLLWHCFGGDEALARRLIRNGWHISIPGPVTYSANSTLRVAISSIPVERLLLETDCPYLAPHPWRGTRNEPAYTVFTCAAVAEAKGLSRQELWKICGDNARRFFMIKD